MKPELSFVVPVYNEVNSLRPLVSEISKACAAKGLSYEVVFINDGNSGNSQYAALADLEKAPAVRVIHLSRNFGQHVAIAAGLKNAHGKYHIVMDADLQYFPEDAIRLYEKGVATGADVVLSRTQQRKHSLPKVMLAKLFYLLTGVLGSKLPVDLGSMFLLRAHISRGLSQMSDRNRSTISLALWLTGNYETEAVRHQSRFEGRSGYNLSRLIKHGVFNIALMSNRPLYLSAVFAAAYAFAAVLFAFIALSANRIFGQPSWWTNDLLLLLLLTVPATVMASLAIMGLYLGKILDLAKKRPLYYFQEASLGKYLLFEQTKLEGKADE